MIRPMSVRHFRVEQFHGNHDQSTHGNWAKGATVESGSIFDDLEGYDPVAANKVAGEIRARAEREEPAITAALARMVGDRSPGEYREPSEGDSGEMFGYAHVLKAQDKIAEKIGRKMVEDGSDFDEASKSIKDSVRYTVHFSENEFGDRAQSVIDELRAENPDVKVKNTWPPEAGIPYKGVNVQVTNPDGLQYEVQFHTAASQVVKDRMHLLFEEQRVLPMDSPRWQVLDDEMMAIGKSQPVPRDAYRVFRVATMETT